MYAATVNNMPRKATGRVRLMDAEEIQSSDPSNGFVHAPPSTDSAALYIGTFATAEDARRTMREWFPSVVIGQ